MKIFKTFLIITIIVLLDNVIMANDTIRFKVRVTERELTVNLSFGVPTLDKSYVVSWGDGSETNYVSEGFYPVFDPVKTYAEPGDYEIKVFGKSEDAVLRSPVFNMGGFCDVLEMDLSNAPNIEYLTCKDKPNLTKLDLRPCTKMIEAYVYNNKNLSELYISGLKDLTNLVANANNLTSIDLSGLQSILNVNFKYNKLTNVILDAQTKLSGINSVQFDGNHLSLKTMRKLTMPPYAITNSGFGWQEVPSGNRKVDLNTPVGFADDTLLLNGIIPTNIVVEGQPYGANPDEYYTVSGAEITFLQDGYYEITLQHTALPNSWIIIPYIAGDLHTEEISFDIDNNYTEFYFNSNSGMAPVTIAWGDGDTSVYYGRGYVDHTYPYSDKWTVKMNISDAEFLEFAMIDAWANNTGLTDIDLSQAKSMIGVFIYDQPNLDSLDLTVCPKLIRTELEDNGLTNIKMTGLDSLEYVIIRNNLSLTSIDISGLSHLDSIFASNNMLTEIKFDETTNLEGLHHYNFELNGLSLPSIYKIYQRLNPAIKGSFANQQFRRKGNINQFINLENDIVLISGKPTKITVSSNTKEIEEGIDYTISGDGITFLNNGAYDVAIMHDSIKNANVAINYVIDSVAPEEIKFDFIGRGWELTLFVSSKLDTVTINWGDGEISKLTGDVQYWHVRKPSYAYETEGNYTVSIKAAPGLYIERFLANHWDMNKLNLSKASSLTYLDVPYNALTTLDISECKKLEYCLISENYLSNINFTGCANLHTLDLSVNEFENVDLSVLPALKRVNLAGNQLTEVQTGNSGNLYEIVANNNLLKLTDLYALSQTLRNYNGNLATTIGYFINQTRNLETVTVNEEFSLSSEALTVGGTNMKVNVMINDTTSAVSGVDYTTSGDNVKFLKNGIYFVILTHDSIRYQHNVVIPFRATGQQSSIEDLENSSIVGIYPNPVSDKLFIRSEENIKRAEIYNIQGKLIKIVENNTKEISVSDLKAGIYMLQIQTENGIISLRFIKH
jgi:hypothetical protein